MNRLGAKQAAQLIERGELTAQKLVRACLERIEARDAELRAWAYVEKQPGIPAAAPLRGVPIGVKDIFDTFDMPTEYGSPIYAGHRPRADSAPVALARRAGGTILGKTVTTEFATFVPAATRNPRNLAHTPGGSSSGSAVAVADFMVPLAFGTQTAGSLIRPGAYCGVVAYKPSYNLLPRAGVKPDADSLDTVGVFARSVEDAAFFVSALTGFNLELTIDRPKIGAFRTPAQVPIAHVVEIPEWDRLAAAHRAILLYEVARSLADEYTRGAELMSPALRERCAAGFALDPAQYQDARRIAREFRARLDALFSDCDVLIAPSATGEAPAGLASTGDVSMNAVWTLLHVPCVSIPSGAGPNGLPLGLQVIGRSGDDARTLACAKWLHSRLNGGG